jgi:hypothetical protein
VTNKKEQEKAAWPIRLMLAKSEHLMGDRLAVYRCVLACFDGKERIPEWAMPELAKMARETLGLEEPISKRGGRHSNPAVQSLDIEKGYLTVRAVLIAEAEGLKGEGKFKRARDLLAMLGQNCKSSLVKKNFYKYRKKFNPAEIREDLSESGLFD